jgi:hypothetical protein
MREYRSFRETKDPFRGVKSQAEMTQTYYKRIFTLDGTANPKFLVLPP